ncbi:hypothetical protein VQ643_11080 [Pseudomonas sp. F1_0610]|uniref:hypothetical protein n=1 Tax=Pseudomonas sp. F1_0610 TaxID=3114284 RepID=UPI0039C272F9
MRQFLVSFTLSIALISLTGCLSNTTKPEASIAQHKGHLILGKDMQAFKRCGSTPEQTLWLKTDEKKLAYLRNAYEQITIEPYEEVYVELLGRPAGPLECQACTAYKGSFELQETLIIRAPQARDCD